MIFVAIIIVVYWTVFKVFGIWLNAFVWLVKILFFTSVTRIQHLNRSYDDKIDTNDFALLNLHGIRDQSQINKQRERENPNMKRVSLLFVTQAILCFHNAGNQISRQWNESHNVMEIHNCLRSYKWNKFMCRHYGWFFHSAQISTVECQKLLYYGFKAAKKKTSIRTNCRMKHAYKFGLNRFSVLKFYAFQKCRIEKFIASWRCCHKQRMKWHHRKQYEYQYILILAGIDNQNAIWCCSTFSRLNDWKCELIRWNVIETVSRAFEWKQHVEVFRKNPNCTSWNTLCIEQSLLNRHNLEQHLFIFCWYTQRERERAKELWSWIFQPQNWTSEEHQIVFWWHHLARSIQHFSFSMHYNLS